jgi:alkylglycerol monooxygenase
MEKVNIYALLGPAILALVLVEFIYCLKKRNGYYSFQDSLIGLGTAIITQGINVAVAVGVLSVYSWIYEHWALAHIEPSPWSYLACYLGVDFLFYGFHRAGHRINILWAAHVPHHSAEELNYAVALRSSFTQRAASFLFYWPLALIGFSPEMILPVVALNLILQLIPHTRVVGRLPNWIHSWLNTPYHHQVHHAANPMYWDKNYGGTFIIWDRIFGTYQDQVEPLYYGVTIHPKSWDATYLNFHWFIVLWKDMVAATHWQDKILIWFKPPGWRPRNLPPYEKQPWRTAQEQIKFKTEAIPGSQAYLIFQLVVSMSTMFLVIRPDSPLSILQRVLLTVLLWANVTSWGAILQSRRFIYLAEYARIFLFYGFLASSLDPKWQLLFLALGVVNLSYWFLILNERKLKAIL